MPVISPAARSPVDRGAGRDRRLGAVFGDGGRCVRFWFRRCNAGVTSGCRLAGRNQAVGPGPEGMAVNPRTGVVYVGNTYQAGSLSVFAASRH
jgi:hypothetical protein